MDLIPSNATDIAQPSASTLSCLVERKREEGSDTGRRRPAGPISYTPTSSEDPNRFFAARRILREDMPPPPPDPPPEPDSPPTPPPPAPNGPPPSKYNTQSTMCSTVLGPATSPLFVTCPTSTIGTPVDLARRRNSPTHSRTWVIPPAAEDPAASQTMVCMESITTRDGCFGMRGELLLLLLSSSLLFASKSKSPYAELATLSAMTSASVSHHSMSSGSRIPRRSALDAI
mmetsp:Transcript_14035/g.30260  ORF Transcript_14035/g.30260 Transcript_14035/m.30260 type:complete len:230 (-) Transcript_14035:432-1121(-)